MKHLATRFVALLLRGNLHPLAGQEQGQTVSIAWWNVENLFDTDNDTLTLDDDFTPQGNNHWNLKKLRAKTHGIYKTLAMLDMPVLVGMTEVESKAALNELCYGTPLRQAGYSYVHYDSPDRRGIDCALLYRKSLFGVSSSRAVSLSDSAAGIFTRDILLVEGVTPAGDTLCILLNHWPSKLGGTVAEKRRMEAAHTLRHLMDSLAASHPMAAVVALGDMNCSPDEDPVAKGMGFGDDSLNTEGIRNLTLRLPRNWGSHKYQGQWSYIDQAFLAAGDGWRVTTFELVRFDHLLEPEKRRPGVHPRRTFQGPRYSAGLSDHLPLHLILAPPTP